MLKLKHLCLLLICSQCNSFGPTCRTTFQNATIDYQDARYISSSVSLYDYNSTQNALRLTVLFKTLIPDDIKMMIKAKKWVKSDYKVTILDIEKPLKTWMQSTLFGFEKFSLEYSRPPITWPLKTNIPYVISGVYLDCLSLPPNLPDGLWLTFFTISYQNKTRLLDASLRLLKEHI